MVALHRPYVHVNVAMTADGKIDSVERAGASISSEADRLRVDELRAKADAILVGGRTLLREDPKLTVRSAERVAERVQRGLPAHPTKVGVVTVAAVGLDSQFIQAGPARVVIFTTDRSSNEQLGGLRARNVELYVHPGPRVDLLLMMDQLRGLGIERLLVEGGGSMIFALLEGGLVDEITTYVAPLIFGGATAPTPADGGGLAAAAAIHLSLREAQRLGDGVVLRYGLK
jgi:2,5-diamino-6-(ribosylamino)-4(3H)-pyrimidinone 5'-phosphate reductase